MANVPILDLRGEPGCSPVYKSLWLNRTLDRRHRATKPSQEGQTTAPIPCCQLSSPKAQGRHTPSISLSPTSAERAPAPRGVAGATGVACGIQGQRAQRPWWDLGKVGPSRASVPLPAASGPLPRCVQQGSQTSPMVAKSEPSEGQKSEAATLSMPGAVPATEI